MSGFEVVVVGVGDAFTARHHTSALLLACEGFHLAVDCPDRYLEALAAAGARAGRALPPSGVDHVLITHVHGDHVNGLEGLAFYKRFVEGKRLGLIASPEVRADLWDRRLAAAMGALFDGTTTRPMTFEDYFEHVPLSWTGETVVGPFRIRTRRTLHHVPTSALLVEAHGRRLGYSCDTAFDPELIRFLAEADLVIHETNLGPAHTPYAALLAQPPEVRAKLRLIHYPDAFDVDGSDLPALREGDVLHP